MQFHAASIGEAVPRENFDALVQSVFDSAVNMRLSNEDRLITLLISNRYELPQGIRVADKKIPLQSLVLSTSLKASMGLPAACRGGILRFDSSPLTVDLRGAPVWKCRVPDLQTDMRSPAVVRAWSSAWEFLNQEQRAKKTDLIANDLFKLKDGSLLSQKLGKPALGLISATEQFDMQGAIHSAEGMIGLGPGVTPSGDDILIGFLAGLWSIARDNATQLSFMRSFGNALVRIATQTSEISRTYLYHATQGQFSSSLSTLAEAIATGGDIEQATRDAMRVGHSSGMDSVTGLLIGLAVWTMEIIPHTVPLP